jgi:hypothetical protein
MYTLLQYFLTTQNYVDLQVGQGDSGAVVNPRSSQVIIDEKITRVVKKFSTKYKSSDFEKYFTDLAPNFADVKARG